MRISKEHGLNPSLIVCFWCGEDTGELALFGASYPKGAEAPMRTVRDYAPCPKCKETFATGILLVEASRTPIAGRPELIEGIWPTGAHAVITEKAAKELFTADVIDNVLKARMAALPPDVFRFICAGGE